MTLSLFLYVVAFVLLVCAGLSVNPGRVQLGWLALAIVLFTAVLMPAIG